MYYTTKSITASSEYTKLLYKNTQCQHAWCQVASWVCSKQFILVKVTFNQADVLKLIRLTVHTFLHPSALVWWVALTIWWVWWVALTHLLAHYAAYLNNSTAIITFYIFSQFLIIWSIRWSTASVLNISLQLNNHTQRQSAPLALWRPGAKISYLSPPRLYKPFYR